MLALCFLRQVPHIPGFTVDLHALASDCNDLMAELGENPGCPFTACDRFVRIFRCSEGMPHRYLLFKHEARSVHLLAHVRVCIFGECRTVLSMLLENGAFANNRHHFFPIEPEKKQSSRFI